MSRDEKETFFNKVCREYNYCRYCGLIPFPSAAIELFQGYVVICERDGTYINKEICKNCPNMNNKK